MEIDEFEEAAPYLPRGFMRPCLARPKEFALRVGSLSFPDAVQDAVSRWVAYFGEALYLEKETTEVDLFDGAAEEVIAE
jgi:hypothetical protein